LSRASHQRVERPIDDRPPAAPWGSFPLVELVVLVGLVMLLAGFLVFDGTRGGVMIGVGLALGSLAGLELVVREHFAGYRSHTLILAAVPAAVVLGLLVYLGPEGLAPLARLAIAALVFGLAAAALMAAFRRRTGGLSLRVRGFRG
jgi:hypothetical protein